MEENNKHSPKQIDSEDNTQHITEQDTLSQENEQTQTEETPDPISPDDITSEIDELNATLEIMKAQILRERADNDNLRKRQERELQNAYKFATEKLIKDLLPIIDSLILGIESAQKNEQHEALAQFISGSEMTLKLFKDTLTRHGVIEIDPTGEKFDPERHEAVSMVSNTDITPNTVMHVTQKGYELNGRIIRAAQVIVAKAL
ncbi:MAG: nucleotide exchange factor GrpE [Cardiobacteriales bacterium]|nr:MAG: nucleotide exchange factor GrpE [Cardiobacteriales bacterium]